MVQNSNGAGFPHREIPVLFYNYDSGEWEPEDRTSERSRAAAMYKNQLDAYERLRATETNRVYEPQWDGGERRLRASINRHKYRKPPIPRTLTYAVLLAAGFYLLWLYAQTM